MTERPHQLGEGAEPGPSQPQPLHCWACEELLAIRSATGGLLLEADARVAVADDQRVLTCGCGACTCLPERTHAGERPVALNGPERSGTPEARLVLDYHHETRGIWRDGAVFRIR